MSVTKEQLIESLEKQIQVEKNNTPPNPLMILNQHYIRTGWKYYSDKVSREEGKYVIQFEILNAYAEIQECQQIP
jgi:hypothetical protein